jgi:hypothetical protein
MPKYSVACECHRQIPVELFQAGTSVECSECHRKVVVPTITALKEQSGDKYPWLSTWQKIAETRANREPPFDGVCQKCRERTAELQVPIKFDAMQERSDAGQSSYGQVTIQHFEERWIKTTFPMLMCAQCDEQFSTMRRASAWKKFLGAFLLILLLGGIAVWVLMGLNIFMESSVSDSTVRSAPMLIRLLAGATITLVIIVRKYRKKSRVVRGDRYAIEWLAGIPLVQDLIAGEDECRISVGKSAPWAPRPFADVTAA